MKIVLLDGVPGVGKTTLIKKILNALKSTQLEVDGFYTEEIRQNNRRIGFDVVSLDGHRATLARKTNDLSNLPSVGPYKVNLIEFEAVALSAMGRATHFLIIDEIGKMELLSEKFQLSLREIIHNGKVNTLLATVPLKGVSYFVRQLKENRSATLFTVSEANRDALINDIVELLVN